MAWLCEAGGIREITGVVRAAARVAEPFLPQVPVRLLKPLSTYAVLLLYSKPRVLNMRLSDSFWVPTKLCFSLSFHYSPLL